MNDLVDEGRIVSGWRWTHDPRVARPFLSLVRRAQEQSIRSFDAWSVDTH